MVHNGDSADAPMIGSRLCGSNHPQPITSDGNRLFVRFHSDGSVTSTGFEIRVNVGTNYVYDITLCNAGKI